MIQVSLFIHFSFHIFFKTPNCHFLFHKRDFCALCNLINVLCNLHFWRWNAETNYFNALSKSLKGLNIYSDALFNSLGDLLKTYPLILLDAIAFIRSIFLPWTLFASLKQYTWSVIRCSWNLIHCIN